MVLVSYDKRNYQIIERVMGFGNYGQFSPKTQNSRWLLNFLLENQTGDLLHRINHFNHLITILDINITEKNYYFESEREIIPIELPHIWLCWTFVKLYNYNTFYRSGCRHFRVVCTIITDLGQSKLNK